MRIGLFGGSFNPIHSGHLGIARKALDDHALDRLLFIPAHISPFKTGSSGVNVPGGFPDEVRRGFVELVCALDSRFELWDVELVRGGVSYAIDTVRAARQRFPDAELFFVIGEDSVPGLSRWREWDELRRLCRFVAYPRTRESSTEIRRRLLAGESVADMVPPCILAPLLAATGNMP